MALASYWWGTSKGTIYIRRSSDGRYHVIFDGESLGSYHSPEAAADDVAGGHTFTPSKGVDFGLLGISHDLVDWQRSKA